MYSNSKSRPEKESKGPLRLLCLGVIYSINNTFISYYHMKMKVLERFGLAEKKHSNIILILIYRNLAMASHNNHIFYKISRKNAAVIFFHPECNPDRIDPFVHHH